jgi:hypothetical protein
VWVADGEVVEEEHAVEGLGEELYLCLVCQFLQVAKVYSLAFLLRTSMYPHTKMATPT